MSSETVPERLMNVTRTQLLFPFVELLYQRERERERKKITTTEEEEQSLSKERIGISNNNNNNTYSRKNTVNVNTHKKVLAFVCVCVTGDVISFFSTAFFAASPLRCIGAGHAIGRLSF